MSRRSDAYFPCLVFLFILGISLGTITSCKTTRKVAETKPLEEKDHQVLIQQLGDSAFRCEWMKAGMSVRVEQGEKSTSFNANLRMKSDSIIWISISPALGIEVVRVSLTKDTIRMLDRLNNEYALKDFNYLNNLFDVSVNYQVLQAILTANYFPYMDEKKLKSAYVDDPFYILSTLNRRKLKRSLEEKDPNKRIIQDIWMDPGNAKIHRMKIEDNKTQREIEIVYSDYREVESKYFPYKTVIHIRGDKPVKMEINYSKVSINAPQEFPFSIPAKYTRVN